MEVPERLALIGGSILLSSTLVFTLKSQASSIIPSAGHSISNVFDHIGDAKRSSDFNYDFQQAQQEGWKTGTWGTAKYYIDKDNSLHIGHGNLEKNLQDPNVYQVKTVNIDQPVQAPEDSSNLFTHFSNMTQFNGTYNIDTSHVTDMSNMFSDNPQLQGLDVSNFDTSNVSNVYKEFSNDTSLRSINVQGWDTQSINNSAWTFANDTSLVYLNLSSWRTPNLNSAYNGMFASDTSLKGLDIRNMNTSANISWQNYMFGGDIGSDIGKRVTNDLSSLTLGNSSIIHGQESLPKATWQNGKQLLSTNQLLDGNAHPGTWVRQ